MIRIELLHTTECPHVDSARLLVRACLAELGMNATIEEQTGAYPSPTVRVNGRDVMGPPAGAGDLCRLDLPTHDRVVAALRGA